MITLADIVAKKRLQLEKEISAASMAFFEKEAYSGKPTRDFEASLRKPGLSVIAEIKKASPSKGVICHDFSPVDIALTYEAGGADCISVLTEEHFFMGSYAILQAVHESTICPTLCKDFILCDFQVLQARTFGADAILLIAALLSDAELTRLSKLAAALGLAVLMEAREPDEIKRIVSVGGRIIGINNRDLLSFHEDISTFGRLRHLIPNVCVAVAESGIKGPADAIRMREAGCDAILVGEYLMRAQKRDEAIKDLKREL